MGIIRLAETNYIQTAAGTSGAPILEVESLAAAEVKSQSGAGTQDFSTNHF
jgi:hypothetical protein